MINIICCCGVSGPLQIAAPAVEVVALHHRLKAASKMEWSGSVLLKVVSVCVVHVEHILLCPLNRDRVRAYCPMVEVFR